MFDKKTATRGDQGAGEHVASFDPPRSPKFSLLPRWQLVRSATLDPRLSRGDIAVLVAILDHMNTRSGDAYPSVDRIAIKANVDRSTATRSIRRLVNHGHLIRLVGRGRAANEYRMPHLCGRVDAPARGATSGRTDEPTNSDTPGEEEAIKAPSGRTTEPVVGASSERCGREDAPRTSHNTGITNTRNGASAPKVGRKRWREKQEELERVTRDAIAAYNESLGKPNGRLAMVQVDVGLHDRARQVKQCLPAVREMCIKLFKSETVTPEFWEAYFASVEGDPFLSGKDRAKGTWMPTFSYLVRPSTILNLFDKESSVT